DLVGRGRRGARVPEIVRSAAQGRLAPLRLPGVPLWSGRRTQRGRPDRHARAGGTVLIMSSIGSRSLLAVAIVTSIAAISGCSRRGSLLDAPSPAGNDAARTTR